MKLFLPLLAFAAAGRQDASYDYNYSDYPAVTDTPVRHDDYTGGISGQGSRPGGRPNGGGGNHHGGNDDGTCTRDDYNNKNKHSWRTNCPSGCGITEYVNELDGQIDDNWNKLVVS